jgi:dihydrolipoamide dehydrogenase
MRARSLAPLVKARGFGDDALRGRWHVHSLLPKNPEESQFMSEPLNQTSEGTLEATQKLHIAVVGGGPGGYAAAFLAADLGMQVTLIDPELNPGGVCLYRGCIPSKALLHVAKLIEESQQAKNWGIEFPAPKIDLARLRSWKEGVVKKLTGGLGILSKQRHVEYIQGRAAFENSSTLRISKADASEVALSFDRIILATGSRPAIIPALKLESPRLMDSTGALKLEDLPRSLLVVGGGYIGLEIGSVYAALGTRVTVVEMLPGLLPGADRDLVLPLHKRLEKMFEAILLNTTVASLKEDGAGIRATFEGAAVQEKDREKIFDRVLVSIGRKPNSEIPGLEATKVRVNPRGFIEVNKQLQTADPSVYAIGDVVGEPMLAHKAMHEGRTAVEAIAGHKVAFEPAAIPAVVFTDPEVAWCGLTETQAEKESREIKVAKFPWAASGRAVTIDRPEGMTKLLLDPRTERVLGVGIVGAGAGELIAEGVLAIEMAALARDVAMSIHPHPTLSETVMESAEVFFGTSTDVYRPKRG